MTESARTFLKHHDARCRYCGKIPFTRTAARLVVAQMLIADRDPQNHQGLNAYRCAQGRRWHVGHSASKVGTETLQIGAITENEISPRNDEPEGPCRGGRVEKKMAPGAS